MTLKMREVVVAAEAVVAAKYPTSLAATVVGATVVAMVVVGTVVVATVVVATVVVAAKVVVARVVVARVVVAAKVVAATVVTAVGVLYETNTPAQAVVKPVPVAVRVANTFLSRGEGATPVQTTPPVMEKEGLVGKVTPALPEPRDKVAVTAPTVRPAVAVTVQVELARAAAGKVQVTKGPELVVPGVATAVLGAVAVAALNVTGIAIPKEAMMVMARSEAAALPRPMVNTEVPVAATAVVGANTAVAV